MAHLFTLMETSIENTALHYTRIDIFQLMQKHEALYYNKYHKDIWESVEMQVIPTLCKIFMFICIFSNLFKNTFTLYIFIHNMTSGPKGLEPSA